MGLPAFDIPAFEAARAAANPAPRVSTSIMLGSGAISNSEGAKHQRDITKNIEQFEVSVYEWRVGALRGAAQMRRAIEQGLIDLPLPFLRHLSEDMARHTGMLAEHAQMEAQSDERFLETIRDAETKAALYSQVGARFLKRMRKRLVEAVDRRAQTYDRLISGSKAIQEAIDQFVSSNSVLPAASMTEEAKAAHLEAALARPADIEGAAERTARRMARFPKVAAYLAS